MKTIITKLSTITNTAFKHSLLMTMSILLCAGVVKADIINQTATTSDGYLANSTSNVVIQTLFETNTMEWADNISFSVSSPASGVTLSHGIPSPSPYSGVGQNRGDEVSGPGWATTGFAAGGSFGGGAFRDLMNDFGISITTDATVTGPIIVDVTFTGDGFGNGGVPSIQVAQVIIQQVTCQITCPDDMTVSADAGMCGANVAIFLATTTGVCTPNPQDMSGFYEVGVHEVFFVANSGGNLEAVCSMMLTVEDTQAPVVANCENIKVSLGAGECEATIVAPFSMDDNCEDIQCILSQNGDVDNIQDGVECFGGGSSYYRVFDLSGTDVNTELTLESVDVGLFATAIDDAVLEVNIYKSNSAVDLTNLELIFSNTKLLGPAGNSFYERVIATGTFTPEDIIVVEVVTQAGTAMGFNINSQTSPSYYKTDFCGVQQPTNMEQAFPGFGALISINASKAAFSVTQTDLTGQSIDDPFSPGVYNLSFDISDASGNKTVCAFSVQVDAYVSSTGSIACNDSVNISLDDLCEVTVTADMVLEGGDYGCFDDYTVTITDANGIAIGNTMNATHVGMTLQVNITDPFGNSCWGVLNVEDKFGSVLECGDVYTTCTGSIEPGDAVSQMVTYSADVNGLNIPNVPSVTDLEIDVIGLNGAIVTDINLVIDIDHSHPSELTASLEAPNGAEVTLMVSPAGDCSEQGIRVTLDDEAMNTAIDLSNASACIPDVIPAISGAYQPSSPLSEFDGIDPTGTWILTISDLSNGNGGAINAVSMVISQTGAKIDFPSTNENLDFVQIDDRLYSVTGIDLCGPIRIGYNDDSMEQECTSKYSEIIERTWSGMDASGNPVIECVQNIYVHRNDLSTLAFPPNFDGLQNATLECNGTFATDSNGHPALSVTGQPSGDFCDNVQSFPYEDTRIDICPQSYKIVRKFKLLEWCSSQVIEHTQVIKIEDSQAPTIPFTADLTIGADSEHCLANTAILRPVINSDCTPAEDLDIELEWAIATNNGSPDPDAFYLSDNISELSNGNFLVSQLAPGRVWMRWTVSDLCGNTSTSRFTIIVEDQLPPFAICDEFTVVGLGGDGLAIIDAITFDDGSFDNCGDIVSYRARKMVDVCGGSNSFAETVTFCCAERGQEVMVMFEVTDSEGLKNTCMVTVSVEDKLPPFITLCPADITLDCQSVYDTTVTGYIEFIDNCQIVAHSFEDNILSENNCGEKTIRRVFTIEDGEGLKNTCDQIITLERDPNDLFDENDINWPSDVTELGCLDDIDPDNAPSPVLNDDNCSLVAAYSEDQVFTLAGACVKILRKWTVIDWCQYNENSPILGQGYWEHTQVIKLNNNIAPTFVSSCNNRDVCVYDEGCQGSVTLTANATDDCTPAAQISYSFEIDVDNDGTIEYSGNQTSVTRIYAEGTHSITWTAEDGCGNFSTCSYLFTVKDCKKPTPYCITSLTTVVMPSSGMITINAEDYDFGSFDNCTPTEDLIYSFSAVTSDKTRTFTCANIPNGESADIELRMYVTDKDGNQDYCTIEIVLQEGTEDQCEENGALISIEGQARTEDFEMIDEALIIMSSSAPEVGGQLMTDANGSYSFTNLPIGYDYEIAAEKNGDYTNGVSTLDLVLIQRHLLGFDEFDSPYKVIASDVDNNERISAADIVALRKLVLGIAPEYPNNQTSWRFVDSRQSFSDVTNPWPYDQTISFNSINADKSQMDLVAVKIGDVNSSATYNVNGTETTETRSSNTMTFLTDEIEIAKGMQVMLPIYAQDFKDILGYQFTIEFDASKLNFNGYEIGALIVSDQHFALNRLDQGMITTSWSNEEPVSVTDDKPLFYLSFTAHGDGDLGDLIDLTSRVTDAEVYNADYTVDGVSFSLRGSDNKLLQDGLTVGQNRPNPFRNTTDIIFNIDNDSPVTLTVLDMAGKVVRKVTNNYTKGSHTITLDTESIAASGILYYRIDADQGSVVRKMIKIK